MNKKGIKGAIAFIVAVAVTVVMVQPVTAALLLSVLPSRMES